MRASGRANPETFAAASPCASVGPTVEHGGQRPSNHVPTTLSTISGSLPNPLPEPQLCQPSWTALARRASTPRRSCIWARLADISVAALERATMRILAASVTRTSPSWLRLTLYPWSPLSCLTGIDARSAGLLSLRADCWPLLPVLPYAWLLFPNRTWQTSLDCWG